MAGSPRSGADNNDPVVQQIEASLAEYRRAHPRARVDVRREHVVSVRIRVIDPDFAGRGRVDREEEVWKLIERLPEETMADIPLVLLLTPEEAKTSLANLDFEHPVPA